MGSAACRVFGLALVLLVAGAAHGQTPPDPPGARPLVIPQVEGERQGKIAGRALACGVEHGRVDAALKAGRARMLAAVGPALTEERYALSLDDAMRLETSLPAPSAPGCAKALAAFARWEAAP